VNARSSAVASSQLASDESTPYRVLIVDDHAELRALLRIRLDLEPDLDVVGEANDGVDAVRLATVMSPSAVVLDDEMPGMSGSQVIPLLGSIAPGIRIVLYTAAQRLTLAAGSVPDAIVDKGAPLDVVVHELRRLLDQEPLPGPTS
jgi:DNA-binding NarL/FixJ family response regulator